MNIIHAVLRIQFGWNESDDLLQERLLFGGARVDSVKFRQIRRSRKEELGELENALPVERNGRDRVIFGYHCACFGFL